MKGSRVCQVKTSNSQFAKKSFGSLSQNLSSAPQKGNIYLLNCKKIKYLTPSDQGAKNLKIAQEN